MASEALKALVLGAVQGLTEFLPVSSSGHLVVLQRLLDFSEPPVLTTVVLHVGTLLATAVVFRRDLARLAVSVPAALSRRSASDPDARLLLLLAAGSVPTAALGLLFRDAFERAFSSLFAVGIGFLATASILGATRLARAGASGRTAAAMRLTDALAIGLAQGVAIAPGVSRSGATIAVALLLGLDRDLAGRYSFLLSLPAVLGANLLEINFAGGLGGGGGGGAAIASAAPLLAGGLAALLSGVLALTVFMGLVRRGRIHGFAYYCLAAGIATLVLAATGAA